jgi:hypothetical protein
MRYKDRVEMDLDIIERHLQRCKDSVDSRNIVDIGQQLVAIEKNVDNIRNMIDLEDDE